MISLQRVDTIEQAQQMRVLRNECRDWMTGSTEKITKEQQETFFLRIKSGEVIAMLLCKDDEPVAYGLLRPGLSGELWMSCGVSSRYRGQGFGTAIVTAITATANDRVLLDVWHDNTPAVRTYEKVGYRLIYSSERNGKTVDLMEYK
jgi:ribosomal protein S18 acetylase RimI-like enzyme